MRSPAPHDDLRLSSASLFYCRLTVQSSHRVPKKSYHQPDITFSFAFIVPRRISAKVLLEICTSPVSGLNEAESMGSVAFPIMILTLAISNLYIWVRYF